MSKITYEPLEAKISSIMNVARVRDGQKDIIVTENAFGPNTYDKNIISTKQTHTRSDTLEPARFRPARTDETMMIAAGNIDRLKNGILNRELGLQAGKIARTREGIYTNVQGEEDEKALKAYLKGAQEVNGIYINSDKKVAFIPYKTFRTGIQETEEFVQGGLARGLELTTRKRAGNLAVIASRQHYPKGISVFDFEIPEGEETVHSVVNLSSDMHVVDGLSILASRLYDDDGYAFGVQTSTE